MPISELGYRHWEGTRVPPARRWLAITRSHIKIAYRGSRLLRRFLIVAWMPLLYFAPVFFAVGYLANPENSLEEGGLLTAIGQGIFPEGFLEILRDNPATILPAIWAVAFYLFLTVVQSFLAMIAVAIVAPPLISRDVRSKAFLLYLSKPISVWEYLLGKLGVAVFFLFVITLFPALLLYLISVALSPNVGTIVATVPILFRVMLTGLVIGVPMHYRLLARCADGPLPDATYFSSGAPMPPAVYAAFSEHAGHQIIQGYGSTETGGIARRADLGAWQPFPGLSWKVQPDTGRLVVRSPWQEDPDRWHVTDDVVEPEGEGFRLLGRADSVTKVAGKRFSVNEVVGAASAMEGVEQAEAVTYERYGEVAVALFVIPSPGATLEEDGVRQALARRLAAFKVPRTVRVLEELPRLSNGKADLRRLKEMV